MFIFNNRKYDNVWFTSDEHYGSDRHISLSKRLEFDETLEIYKKMEGLDPAIPQKLRLSSVYGQFGSSYKSPTDKMNDELIRKHNMRVGDNDLVFHLGDFGDYSYAKYLNGYHVLLMGNYEYDECDKEYGSQFGQYRDVLMSGYNFIDVLKDYKLDVQNSMMGVLSPMLKEEVSYIYMTHKPEDCKYTHDHQVLTHADNRYIMNLFGHIHEKGKIKRFGLNVGVDCNHFYPVSSVEVVFYLKAILHYYDENVFM